MSELGGSREIPSDAELLRKRQIWGYDATTFNHVDAPIVDEGALDDPYHTPSGRSRVEQHENLLLHPPSINSLPKRLPDTTLPDTARSGAPFNEIERQQLDELLKNELPYVAGTDAEGPFLSASHAQDVNQLARCIGDAAVALSSQFAGTPASGQALMALRAGRIVDAFAFAWADQAAVHATAQQWLTTAIGKAETHGHTAIAKAAREEMAASKKLQQQLSLGRRTLPGE